MALKRITLKQLSARSRENPKFFKAVLRDPRKAVKGIGRYLTPKDLKKLSFLKKTFKIRGKDIAIQVVYPRRLGGKVAYSVMIPGLRPPWPPR